MKNKAFKHILNAFLIICVGVFIYYSYALINAVLKYRAIDNLNNEVRGSYIINKDNENHHLTIDWNSLLRRNNDVIAWIYIPNTNINHPILQGENNDVYLHRDINRNHSIAGSIFADSRNSYLFNDLNTIIYRHNMRNGSMFADINRYVSGETDSFHPYIYISLPNGDLKIFEIVSINRIDTSSALYEFSANTKEEYYQIISQGRIKGNGIDANDINQILTLSTCYGFTSNTQLRTVIFANLKDSR